MSIAVDFSKDRLDSEGNIIPSDNDVMKILERDQIPMNVAKIAKIISEAKGEAIKKIHVSNTLLRLHRAKKVNKHIERGKANEWRVGWGCVVNMSKDGYSEDVSYQPKRPKRPIITPANGSKSIPVIKKQVKIKNHTILYATASDRVAFAHFLGYKTIDEACQDIGSWDFEAKLKAHLKFNTL